MSATPIYGRWADGTVLWCTPRHRHPLGVVSASDNVSYQKQTARSAAPNRAVPSADELGASPHVLGQGIIGPFRRMRESADLGLPTIREGLMDPNPRISSVPPTAVASGLGFGVYLTPYSAEAGDLPRGSQEEGRRHGGRRPIKVYALHSCQRRIGLEFGGARGPSLKPDLNPSKPVPSTRMRTVSEGSLDLFD